MFGRRGGGGVCMLTLCCVSILGTYSMPEEGNEGVVSREE